MAKSEESFKLVLGDIASNPESTRSDIARRVGMSAMNIGRLVSMLIESRAVFEGHTPSGSRHSLPIILNADKFLMIFDFSGRDFFVYDVSLMLGMNKKSRHVYDDKKSFGENAKSAFELGGEIIKIRNRSSLAGIAVIMPQGGPHDIQGDNEIYDRAAFEAEMKKELSLKNVSFISFGDAVLPAVFEIYRDAKPTYYINGGNGVRACFCADEFAIDIPDFPDFNINGNIRASDIFTDFDFSSGLQDVYELLVPQIRAAICPERVIIDISIPLKNGYIENEDGKLPKVTIKSGNMPLCVYGAAIILRDAWIDRVVTRICNKRKDAE